MVLAPYFLDLSEPAPRLHLAAFPPDSCANLAQSLFGLELSRLALVKAFHPSGSADSLAPVSTGLDWVSEYGSCASLPGHATATTLRDAVAQARGPLSARIASSAHLRGADAGLTAAAGAPTGTDLGMLHCRIFVQNRGMQVGEWPAGVCKYDASRRADDFWVYGVLPSTSDLRPIHTLQNNIPESSRRLPTSLWHSSPACGPVRDAPGAMQTCT